MPKKFSYNSMGTTWEITVWDDIDEVTLENLKCEIFEMSDAFDNTYSRFIKTSLVWKISEKAGIYEVPPDFLHMLSLYIDFYEPSEKKLNPLIGFTISDLGYDEHYSLIPKKDIRNTPDLFDAVLIIDESHIKTNQTVLFDFGALGKGYFVDKIADFLKEKNINRFLVNGSGDIYYSGGKSHKEPIKVGLEHPHDPSLVIGSIEIDEGAMCASGINRRKWENYHHVIDPHTNTSIGEEIVATWVIAKNAALTDALASCLFFVPPEALSKYQFEYVIMNNENKVKTSHGWNGELF